LSAQPPLFRIKNLASEKIGHRPLFPSRWTFPSGEIEETDSPVRDAVIREVKEETSLDFFSKEKLGFYESAVNGRHYIALVHLGEWSGAIRLQPEEISEHKFFTFKENQSFDCGVCVSRSD
jgi:8-oxo-dGTP pyrophosphatase MutT (NUDIX family)